MDSSTVTLDINSSRAKKARLSKIYNRKPVISLLMIITLSSLVVGIGLIVAKNELAWVILIPAVIAYMFYAWIKGDLDDQKINTKEGQVENLISLKTLGKIKTSNPSCFELWQAIDGNEASYFLGNRYALSNVFFEQFTDKSEGSAKRIWPIAEALRQKYELEDYSDALLLVALVKDIPNTDQLLSMVHIDTKDLETAIPWFDHVIKKRSLVHSKNFLGGIGRDWAYGYTPILRSVGYNITEDIERHGFFTDTSHHQKIVEQMQQMLSSGSSTVTLVGDSGVGKTTCVHAFAEDILTNPSASQSVKHHQVIQLDAPTLISRAKNPGQMEEIMIRIFNEAHTAKNIILFFDDAEGFFGGGAGNIDLSHVLMPALESSGVKVILAMNSSAWQRMGGSSVAGKLQPLNILQTNESTTLAVLCDSIALAEYKNKSVFTYNALRESYRLGKRYVDNLAMPAAALKILEQSATINPNALINTEEVQASVEQTYGIKLQATTASESSKLLNLEEEIKHQVISQDRAVKVVADALRRARSGVGNPNRPVGTFLFLGPTGVGKTELAKALARSYFGDESAMIRLDMNQFVGADDVSRLIQPMVGDELGFLGQVKKQPFSVVLLDEIEKADRAVVNSLLQMLDEGEMKDSDNKSVSFKDAVVIATSNAGADKIRQIIDSGENLDEQEDKFVEDLISDGQFAPELINRFDEVVLFKPLSQDELIDVIDIIIDGINKSLDSQKVKVELSEDAKKWLVEKGYDSKLGARPMRRMAQRYVENTVVKKLLSKEVGPGAIIRLEVGDIEA